MLTTALKLDLDRSGVGKHFLTRKSEKLKHPGGKYREQGHSKLGLMEFYLIKVIRDMEIYGEWTQLTSIKLNDRQSSKPLALNCPPILVTAAARFEGC